MNDDLDGDVEQARRQARAVERLRSRWSYRCTSGFRDSSRWRFPRRTRSGYL